MLRNFFKIAFRNLTRRKGYAITNILGLAVGIACCLLIFVYVAYERSYDTFNRDAGRIFRVQDEEYQNGRIVAPCAAAMPGVAPAMKREFPEVENACRLLKVEVILSNNARNLRFREKAVYYADAAALDIFHIPLREGDAKTALSGLGKALLSTEEARKYFGGQDPLGKVLTLYDDGGSLSLEVTGVFDYPANSHLKFSVLVSYPTYSRANGTYGRPNDPVETAFGWTDFYTYVLLRKGVDPQQLVAKLPAFIDRHYNNLPENKTRGDRYSLSLMPLTDIHLYSHYNQEAEANGDGKSVSFLLLTAFLIIGIAWINYINLATARSLERAREVGVRKVLGALRQQLIRQFMMESLFLNMLALLTAFVITLTVSPLFARLTGRPLPSLFGLSASYWGQFAAVFVVGTLLSGIYPALVLSRYQPVAVLKGLFKNAAGGQWLRKGLIVGQFAASIFLIAGTVIVYRQLHYMRNQELGANISQTLVVRGAGSTLTDSVYRSAYQAFKGELLQTKGIKSVTASTNVMGEEIEWSTNWKKLRSSDMQEINLFHVGVDNDFISSYGLKLLAGRAFSASYGTERKAIILNESAVRALGISSPQAAIGELLSGGQNNMDSLKVVGVLADFHSEGLQKAIQPLVFFPDRNWRANYSVKIQGEDPAVSIATIKKIWTRYFPADPYDYFFLDEFFDRQYLENQRFGSVFALFAILAIGIACFGLLGLSAYNVLQRTKEIGIRKVLGASVQSLLFVLSRDFLVLVTVAFVVIIPVIGIAMGSWLQGFVYRVGISWWIYAVSGALAILIALLTVGIQALKASMANPVKSLRME